MRERILEATIELVCEGGPAAATARHICKAAGISAPTLYYHFGDLYSLYDEVLQLMYVPEAQAFPGREFTDPRGMIDYMWDCCVGAAKSRPGLVELKNYLVSIGKVPQSLNRFSERVERTFEQLALHEPLNFPPKEAAAIFWCGAIGAALKLAAVRRGARGIPQGAEESLRSLVMNGIIDSTKVPKPERSPRAKPPKAGLNNARRMRKEVSPRRSRDEATQTHRR